jgi:hypothetical protein
VRASTVRYDHESVSLWHRRTLLDADVAVGVRIRVVVIARARKDLHTIALRGIRRLIKSLTPSLVS